VVLLRDGPAGLEVFLVQRHGASDVLGGAHVFPGGKVDGTDAQLAPAQYLDQAVPPLQTQLAEPGLGADAAAGLFVAAIREAWEECGVLFAEAQTGAAATPAPDSDFAHMLAQRGLRLQTRHLAPWSRWITPLLSPTMSRRFDTRFFLATLPAGQEAIHDNHEAVASVWLTPRAALLQYQAGQIELVPPQIMSLVHLMQYGSAAQALDAARRQPPPLILPEGFDEGDTRVLCYPGDPRHPVRQRALPGPTRLEYRHKRFRPPGGFAVWLGGL
jgi:8-oxo-dGTP pyrophosphatase MutT (NUDIX family)